MAYDGPDLSELLQYGLNQGTPITELGDEQQRLLDTVKQIDPNASWKWQDNSGSSNEGGNQAASNWVLDFDHTKFPTASPGGKPHEEGGDLRGMMLSSGDLAGTQYLGTHGNMDAFKGDSLIRPEYQWDTPYGQVTDSRNVHNDRTFMDSVFQYAPMAIMALATMGAGAPLMSGVGGAITAGGGSTLESILASLGPGFLDSASHGNINYGTIANMLSRLAGAPSWLGSLASQGTNYLTGGKKP